MSTGEQSKVDNLLHISWCDSRWVPVLSASNILEYFTERSNPFYSKDCNNEFLKMQQNTRLDQLTHMQGVEYCLLHAQDPILYIVRKQHRYSPTHVNPLSCYHIIGGQVFQTPDLSSVINSRLISSIDNLSSAFSEMQSYAQYHPSKGYSWHIPKHSPESGASKKAAEKKKPQKEVSSAFQRRRVDSLLGDLALKFPFKVPANQSNQQQGTPAQTAPGASQATPGPGQAGSQGLPVSVNGVHPQTSDGNIKTEDVKPDPIKSEVKVEVKAEAAQMPQLTSQRPVSTKPPPEKRQKLG